MTVNLLIMFQCDIVTRDKVLKYLLWWHVGVEYILYFILLSSLLSSLLYKYRDIFLNIFSFLVLQPKESSNLLLPAKYWQNVVQTAALRQYKGIQWGLRKQKNGGNIKSLLPCREERRVEEASRSWRILPGQDGCWLLSGAGRGRVKPERGGVGVFGSACLSHWEIQPAQQLVFDFQIYLTSHISHSFSQIGRFNVCSMNWIDTQNWPSISYQETKIGFPLNCLTGDKTDKTAFPQ